MKIWIYSIITCICLTLPAMAQRNVKQIESVKVAYITQRLDLTTEESQRFWPIYNTYQQDMQRLIVKRNAERKARKDRGETVDELKLESDILELRKRYRMEFSKAIPRSKVAAFFQAEREFRKKLMEHLSKRKAGK